MIVFVLIFVLLLLYVGLHVFYAYKVLHPKKSRIIKTPTDYDMEYTDFQTITNDKLKIKGWFIKNETQNKGTLILSHNLAANRGKMLQYAKFLHTAGYSIVLYDLHSHGESETDRLGFRIIEKNEADLLAVIKRLKQEEWFQKSNHNIALIGFSVGTVNTVGVYAKMPEIKAAITDCGPFTDINDVFRKMLKRTVRFSRFIWKPLFNRIIRIILFDSYDDYIDNAIKGMKAKAIFIIHGEKDFIIPVQQTKDIFNRIESDKKEYWLVPYSHHLTAYSLYEEEYKRRVLNFLEKYMG